MNEQEARAKLAELDMDQDRIDEMIACAKEYQWGTWPMGGIATEYDRHARTFAVTTFTPFGAI